MNRAAVSFAIKPRRWARARAGDLRRAVEESRRALEKTPSTDHDSLHELRLVIASCLVRQGQFSEAGRELEAAALAAADSPDRRRLLLRVDTWRAEVAYFQGRYSNAEPAATRLLPLLIDCRDYAYAALALRIRMLVLLARADYEAIDSLASRAVELAEASGDAYVLVQVLNLLGAAQFDRATSKLPLHARSHLSSLDPHEVEPMESDARAALRIFEQARGVARRARLKFAAWYVAGNIERLQILLGHSERAVGAIRKRLDAMQKQGAKYDEIVTRSNLAWALRTLGQNREALHELDVALDLARRTGTFNVLLEFLHYDRSIVLGALGDSAGARASYHRYLKLVRASGNDAPAAQARDTAVAKRPLDPFFLKRADRFIQDHLGESFGIEDLARHCGVSWRTLQNAFVRSRGLAPVTHIRNMRLDRAHDALESGGTVAEIAAHLGFRSVTSFAREYRKRFGIQPSRQRRARA